MENVIRSLRTDEGNRENHRSLGSEVYCGAARGVKSVAAEVERRFAPIRAVLFDPHLFSSSVDEQLKKVGVRKFGVFRESSFSRKAPKIELLRPNSGRV